MRDSHSILSHLPSVRNDCEPRGPAPAPARLLPPWHSLRGAGLLKVEQVGLTSRNTKRATGRPSPYASAMNSAAVRVGTLGRVGRGQRRAGTLSPGARRAPAPLGGRRRLPSHVTRCSASDEELERAIKEAQEILGQAAAIAQQQTRFELELANMTDQADRAKKEDAKEEEWTRKDKEDRFEQLNEYWRSAGLHPTRATRFAKRMIKHRSPYAKDLQLLQAKVERLERTLPGVDVPDVLAKQPSLLVTEIPTVVAACMVLSQIFEPALLPSIITVRVSRLSARLTSTSWEVRAECACCLCRVLRNFWSASTYRIG